jgi:hypothetical protein
MSTIDLNNIAKVIIINVSSRIVARYGINTIRNMKQFAILKGNPRTSFAY